MPLDGHPSATCRLPEGWSEPERVEDAVDADGLLLRRAGFASSSGMDQAVGSAADWQDSPSERAWFELLERVALLEASRADRDGFDVRDAEGEVVGRMAGGDVFPVSADPARWSFARSNGVALHADWATACQRAAAELVERDRVQRAWLGQTAARPLELDVPGSPLARTRSYEWSAYTFPAVEGAPFPDVEVVGLFGFPKATGTPLVFGYGARSGVAAALACAMREAAQMLAFVWGEPIPEVVPALAPTPLAHLERFQVPAMHAVLRRWLDEGHASSARGLRVASPQDSTLRMVDLTPPWLGQGLRVVRAVGSCLMPLTFGESPFFAHLPPELRIHPIP